MAKALGASKADMQRWLVFKCQLLLNILHKAFKIQINPFTTFQIIKVACFAFHIFFHAFLSPYLKLYQRINNKALMVPVIFLKTVLSLPFSPYLYPNFVITFKFFPSWKKIRNNTQHISRISYTLVSAPHRLLKQDMPSLLCASTTL